MSDWLTGPFAGTMVDDRTRILRLEQKVATLEKTVAALAGATVVTAIGAVVGAVVGRRRQPAEVKPVPPNYHNIACPLCKAPSGQRCTTRTSGTHRDPHSQRIRRWQRLNRTVPR